MFIAFFCIHWQILETHPSLKDSYYCFRLKCRRIKFWDHIVISGICFHFRLVVWTLFINSIYLLCPSYYNFRKHLAILLYLQVILLLVSSRVRSMVSLSLPVTYTLFDRSVVLVPVRSLCRSGERSKFNRSRVPGLALRLLKPTSTITYPHGNFLRLVSLGYGNVYLTSTPWLPTRSSDLHYSNTGPSHVSYSFLVNPTFVNLPFWSSRTTNRLSF